MSKIRVAFLMVLSAAAGAAGHFYWNTYMTVENAKKAHVEDAVALSELDSRMASDEAVTTVDVLPIIEEKSPQELRELELKRITNDLSANNSEVIDSRVFDSKEACDATVRNVAAEYERRGIPSTDMVETSPFPDSTGLVVMLRNNDYLYYAGCVTREDMDWAAYVHFKPKGK